MIRLLNYEMQKRLILLPFLFIFAVASYFTIQLIIAEQITEKAMENVPAEAVSDAINKELKELSEVVGKEVWNRVKDKPIGKKMLIRLLQDIIAIEIADNLLPNCKQYVLIAKKAGMYPILQTTHHNRPEIKGWIWLNVGEVWRYGTTIYNQKKRYPNDVYFVSKDGTTVLTDVELEYEIQVEGTMKAVLIEEKIKIYTYPLLPECIARVKSGEDFLSRSPGNKMYR